MIFARTGLLTAVSLAMILLSGAALGANAAAADEPLPDVDGLMKDEVLTEDGKLASDVEAERPKPYPDQLDELERLSPDTPRVDSALRQSIIKPMLLAAIWIADKGAGLGYAMATTIGLGPTKVLLQGSALAVVAVPIYRVYRLFTEGQR